VKVGEHKRDFLRKAFSLNVTHPVFSPGHEVIDGNRCGNFMTEYGVQMQNINVIGGVVDMVGIKNLFSDGFSHDTPYKVQDSGFRVQGLRFRV
jgi:hypothetical protein